MTELAYLANSEAAYTRSFSARVTARPPGGVVFDRTYFYPTGGGQLADHGSVIPSSGASAPIIDVNKSGSSVIHRLSRGTATDLSVGLAVNCEIDWERRHRHMRLHTGQHLLSALLFTLAGLRTRQASMAGHSGVVELEAPWPPALSIASLQERADRAVRDDLRVTVRQIPRTEWQSALAPRSGLVPLPAHVDPVRVIEIERVDQCPCGGTHVRSLGEVGSLRLDPPVPSTGGGTRLAFTIDGRDPTTPLG